MDQYINTLLDQIRCRKIRPSIEKELRAHMEEQIEANEESGMTKEEAVKAAVADMGNPVEAGIELDRIHRPEPAKEMIIVMAVITTLGILIQIVSGLNAPQLSGLYGTTYIVRTIAMFAASFAIMLLIYRIDYSVIAKFSKELCVFILGDILINNYIIRFDIRDIEFLIFLIVPVFGALLYQYIGTGFKEVAKAILWIIATGIIVMMKHRVLIAIEVVLMMSIVLTIAVIMGWFQINRKKFLSWYWGCCLVIPTVLLVLCMQIPLMKMYQIERVRAFFVQDGDMNYITSQLRNYLVHFKMVGGSAQVWDKLPEFNRDYVIVFIGAYYGSLAAIAVCAILLFLLIRVFQMVFKQHNQLGMLMGCGCGVVFSVCILTNLGLSMGLLPNSNSFLPFFSGSGAGILLSYCLAGIVMSIYRYKNTLERGNRTTTGLKRKC